MLAVEPSNVPFTYTSYPVTATLSEDALHVISALESVTFDAATLVGVDGAVSSGGVNVVTSILACVEVFPASSVASTATL